MKDDELLAELLMRFVEWCNTRAQLLEPKNHLQLGDLIRKYRQPLKWGWWPEPAYRFKGQDRERVMKIVADWIARDKAGVA